MNNRPIGVFDSGIGGLTVVKAIMNALPNESIVYFGDLVHLPYGNKSEKAIKQFAVDNTNFLIEKNVKMVVVACNSATSIAIEDIKKNTELPVVGVVNPGAEKALLESKEMNIGVIGTSRTIFSKAYEKAIKNRNPKVNVFQKATPLLVPLIENNWIEKEATRLIIREYLDFFKNGNSIDSLVLGCTHYPLIKKVIEEEYPGVRVIDSANACANAVNNVLTEKNIKSNQSTSDVIHQYFVNDLTEGFKELANRIIGKKIEIVNISEGVY